MGGCASKPKEFETRRDAAPVEEEPAKAVESVATEDAAADKDKSNVVGASDQSQDEAPLVDLSKPEEDEKETKATAADQAVPALLVLPGEAEIVVENPKGETVEVEVAAKEGEIIFVEAVKETKKEEEDKDQPKKTASEDKNEELLVKVWSTTYFQSSYSIVSHETT